MREILATGYTLPEAYHKALVKLSAEPSGECGMTMEVLNPIEEPSIQSSNSAGHKTKERGMVTSSSPIITRPDHRDVFSRAPIGRDQPSLPRRPL